MAYLHGIDGTLSWTADLLNEANEAVSVVGFNAMRLRPNRRMVETTPFDWNCREYMPDIYGWTAEFDCWVQDNVQPGFFNTEQALLSFRTKSGSVPVYNGYVWIEDIRVH